MEPEQLSPAGRTSVPFSSSCVSSSLRVKLRSPTVYAAGASS
ncbi:MAG: hypothetical protein U0M53_05845 [Oscillospiraceae bacterium]|nr:hypothetical protein [Oscillospiraceae bacterium]